MRALAWLPGLALVVVVPFLFFPERFGLEGLSPWARLAIAFAAAGVAGALSARASPATPVARVAAATAAPTAVLGGLFGLMTALAPEHLLLVVFALAAFVSCVALGARLAAGGGR